MVWVCGWCLICVRLFVRDCCMMFCLGTSRCVSGGFLFI